MANQLHRIPQWRTIMNAPKFLKDPISLMEKNISQYGDTYTFTMGSHPAIFTADPLFIQHVLQKAQKKYQKSPPHFDKLAQYLGYGLLTIDGQRWRKQRRLIQPGFHKQRIANLLGIMNTVVSEFLEEFDQKIQLGPVDIYDEMQQLAFNIVARSIFNLHIDQSQLTLISKRIIQLQQYVIKEIRTPFLLPWLKLSGQYKNAQKYVAETDQIIMDFIEARKKDPQQYDDLLQMLLDARYEDTGEPMDAQQILDEVKILFVAGHDTTANALSWMWYLLEQHPEWVQKLREELSTQLGAKMPSIEDLPKLPLGKQVIEEAMRLYPPAWITDRMSLEDDHFNGIDIKKDTMLITFFYGAHHHPNFWDAPGEFRPERFAPENKDNINSAAYLPFGSGPRMCIGNNFAMMEMQLVLARMIQYYDFKFNPKVPVEKLALVTLKPKNGIWMDVNKR